MYALQLLPTIVLTILLLDVEVECRYAQLLYNAMTQQDYDKDLRPVAGGPPVNISVFMFVTSIHSLSEISMDYGITLFLSLHWGDPRLEFNGSEAIDLRSDSQLLSQIWTPDLYFVNVKEGSLHEVTVKNKHIRVHPDGRILYDMRVSLTLICHLYLHRFPMDEQSCGIQLESFGYTTRDIQLFWDEEVEVHLDSELAMPEFSIGEPVAFRKVLFYPGLGYYDQLQCTFPLSRELIFYVMEYYVPSFLLVVLSWVSFWLNIEASPARASLGITTALTLTTLSSAARAHMARVSYTKAIDIWMLICSVFVFAALLEFAMTSYVHTKATGMSKKYRHIPLDSPVSNSPLKRRIRSTEISIEERHCLHESAMLNIDLPLSHIGKRIITKRKTAKDPERLFRASRNIDIYSRGLFPLVFLLFNIVYWPIYLRGDLHEG